MTTKILRDTISHETIEYPEATANRMLRHPVLGKRLEEVRVDKPEVLGPEALIGEDGEKQPIEDTAKTEKKDK